MVCSRVVFGVFFLLNLVLWTQGSSAAIPFSTLIALLALWFGISVPLTFVGAYFGYKKRVSFMSPEPNFFICMLFGITIEKFLCLYYWSLSEMGFILSLFDNLDHKKWKFHFPCKKYVDKVWEIFQNQLFKEISSNNPFIASFYFFQPIEHPVRTNQIPRQIPDQSFYTRPLPGILMGGVLPFGCIFIQLFFILNSIW